MRVYLIGLYNILYFYVISMNLHHINVYRTVTNVLCGNLRWLSP
uniref:Uncharacterized protein n=1 Tax=Anguilla anguilla TaxID=7936 RepID=A0A0E9WXV7_ANGAN